MTEPVTIDQIASITDAKLTGDKTIQVTDVSHDSRRAGKGTLFAAVAGALFDAHKFVPQVMGQGAVGVFSERPVPEGFNGAWLQVADIRRAMARAAAERITPAYYAMVDAGDLHLGHGDDRRGTRVGGEDHRCGPGDRLHVGVLN